METKFLIYEMVRNEFISNRISSDGYSNKVDEAHQLPTYEEAVKFIDKLPAGIYNITKVFIKS